MSQRRKTILTAFCALFVLAHLSYYATGDHHWPLLGYAMYSYTIGQKTGDKVVLGCPVPYGVPEDQTKPEFRLRPGQIKLGHGYLFAFRKMIRYPHRNASYEQIAAACAAEAAESIHACAADRLVTGGLSHLYERYERQRKNKPKLPPLRGVKLYDVEYEVVPGEAVFNEKSRRLLGEWSRPGAETSL